MTASKWFAVLAAGVLAAGVAAAQGGSAGGQCRSFTATAVYHLRTVADGAFSLAGKSFPAARLT